MDDRFKSSQSDASAPNATGAASLEAGLAALKRKDYATAIALLQPVAQASADKAVATKAQMSLVMAHDRSGNLQQAIALSQALSKSSNRQVRLWAIRMVDELSQRQPKTTSEAIPSASVDPKTLEDTTGFVPLEARPHTSIQSEQTTLQSEESVSPMGDESGFVPLDATAGTMPSERSPISAEEEDATGFMPLDETQRHEVQVPREVAPQPETSSPQATSSAELGMGPGQVPDDAPVETEAVEAEAVEAEAIEDTPPPVELPSPATQRPTSRRQSPIASSRSAPTTERTWRQAGRASKWGSLGAVDLATLWAVEVGTVVVLVFVLRAILQGALALFNTMLVQIYWLIDLRQFILYADPFWLVVAILGVLFFTTPWVMDGILRQAYQAKSLSLSELEAASPEAVRVLKRVCNQRRHSLPSLRVLPGAAPVAFSYGFLPQHARMVVSRGLLHQLDEDEIAAVLMGEWGHIRHWDFAVLSWLALVAQLPYLVYWRVATWGDRQRDAVLRAIATGIAAFGYGLFWVVRSVGLWLSRLRLYYSDRTASELTGNPNGLTRALLKITIGIADDIQRQRFTHPLLESFDLLTPVGYQTALTLGSACSYSSFETLLQWGRVNPYRRWLAINNTHPPMGDRLQQLTHYARHWRLATELDFNASDSTGRLPHPTRRFWQQRFWQQSAPFVGMVIGLLIAGCFWLVGTVAAQVGRVDLIWMSGDRSILWGCLLTGFSIGSILRINAFFPDLKPSTVQIEPSLPDLLSAPHALPIDSQPIRLQGTLLGKTGIGNTVASDLMLRSQTGLIKLHYLPLLGPVGNLLPQSIRPSQLVNSSVTVTGWFRRGATPWIDVDSIQPQRGAKLQAAHPLWSTLLAFSAGVLGAYIIFRGGA